LVEYGGTHQGHFAQYRARRKLECSLDDKAHSKLAFVPAWRHFGGLEREVERERVK
jgi:hypothetical protein